MLAGVGLGIWLIIAGLALVLLVWLVLWLLPGEKTAKVSEAPSYLPDTANSIDAVLIVEPGGRVNYMNSLARHWFDMAENDEPDIERLTRRVRPADQFLDVCVMPGQKRVTIGGRLMEVTSYEVPGTSPLILVTLRAMDLGSALIGGTSDSSTSILKVVKDFSQAVSLSLSLMHTLQAVLENISRLTSSDILELKLWDTQSDSLIPYRFDDPNSPARVIVRASVTQFGEFTSQLLTTRQPVFIASTEARSNTAPRNAEIKSIHSYLGIPLIVGDKLVGTLEAGQTSGGSFGQHDLDLLLLVSGQAASALRNAGRYEEEEKRSLELSGLANLTQAFSSIQDVRDLFASLIESISLLFNTDIIGFLLFDEDKSTLEGQIPFRGIPAHIVEIFRSSIPSGSSAEQVLNSRNSIYTLDASKDESWRLLGFTNIAIAASLRDCALIPLVSSSRVVGYFLLAHHRGGTSAFTKDESRLIDIVADQVAAIVDNALLVQHARIRSQRSDSLRRIASLSASSATLNEVLTFSIQELANLFQAEAGAVFLLNSKSGELTLEKNSAFGVDENTKEAFKVIYIDQPQYRQTVSGSQRSFVSGRLSTDRRVSPPYQQLAGVLHMESVLLVPLVARDKSIGELMLGNRRSDYFTTYDLQIVSTAAGLLATAIENSNLLKQTDDSLRQKVDQLSSASVTAREISASLEYDHLLQIIYEEALKISHATCGSVIFFKFNENDEIPHITHSIGCFNSKVVTPFELAAIKRGSAIEMPDFFSQIDYSAPHESVHSALLVPIVHHGKTTGLIQLHSSQAAFFKSMISESVQSLALQSGIALENARQYNDERLHVEVLRRRAETLVDLSNVSYSLNLEEPLEGSLLSIAHGISKATSFQVVLISIFESETGMLRRVTGVGIPQDILNELLSRKQPYSSVQSLLRPEFKIGRTYYIPADQTPIVPSDVHMVTLQLSSDQKTSNSWYSEDFLLIPLEDGQGNPIGLISLDDPSNGLRPDMATISSLEAFAAQATLVITNVARASDLKNKVDALTAGLQRQQKLLSVTQNDVPILLRKDLEQTISVHSLERRAQRVRAGLLITESVSRQLDASSALMALAREVLTQLNMSASIVAESGAEGPRLLHILGSVPKSTNVDALFGQRNPLRSCLQSGEPLLVATLEENEEWRDAPLLTSLRAKAFICLPVMVENVPVAAMLAVSPEPLTAFTDEDRQVYYQISRQTSVILQNISLLNETRRRLQEVNLLLEFSQHLSGLSPEEILRSLLDSARRVLHSAHAGNVLLWDFQSDLLVSRAVSGYADNESLTRITYRSGEALPGSVYASRKPRKVDEINFSRDYNISSENLLLYRQATGGRIPVSSLLVPIISGDRNLGLLVLDNFNATGAFKVEDETLLLSLTQQVALSLENVRLVLATQERAGQLQALNDVAASLTSNLRNDQLVKSLLDQLAPVIPFDTATLLVREKDRLKVMDVRGFEDNDQRLGLSLAVADSAIFNEMSRKGQPVVVSDVREDPRFPRVDAPRLSWLGIPMISKGELVGVITLEKAQVRFYNKEQAQVAATFASQAAVALENATLYEDSLSRAAELDQRSQRLMVLNRFSASLGGLLDVDQILQLTAQELLQALTNVKRISIITFEGEKAIWKLASPRTNMKLPRPLPHAPIFDRLRSSMGLFTSDNIANEPDLMPLKDMLGQDNASLMIVPLGVASKLTGLLFAYTPGQYRFTSTEVDLARTMVTQASITLENARLYESSVRTAERFAALNETSSQISANLNAEEIYQAVHKAAKRVMPVESFVISLLDEDTNEIIGAYLIDHDQRSPATRVPRSQGLTGKILESGQPLLISGDEVKAAGGIQYGDAPKSPLSIIAVPMTLGGKTLGMLSAQSYEPNIYTDDDVQILGTLANQTIVALQNSKLLIETQTLAAEQERRVVERTAQLQHEQQNTETLLRILTEVSSSLDLDRALNRTLSLLNDAIGAEQGTIMLLHAEDNLLHYRAGYGYLSERADGVNRTLTLKVGEGLAGWVVQNREATLVDDLHEDSRWTRSPSSSQDHRSALITPMLVSEDVIGVLMVFHREVSFFSPEMLNLVKAIASQVAVAINNAHLYELIRDQAERLGVMLRKEQEEASRSQAILEAVADGVLVTGADNRITFVNYSIERILGLKVEQILGQSLDVFGGLFGKTASDWMETIRLWSEAPASYQTGDSYAEQIELENGHIALVHLAPVILQNDFLGTVSIFRDITHEVEVDRLKSEFVATVSHELRTPMTAIKGYVEILLMGAAGAIGENQAHFLSIVKNNIERLNSLVDDLLDISRIESGRVTLTPQPLEMREVAEDVIAELLRRSQEEKKPMAVSLDAEKNLPPVVGDVGRVRQILGNLVDNAYHYTPENGTIHVNIYTTNGNGEKQLRVDVQDNGVGIAVEDQERIFDRFYRGEHPLVLATPGTGLGLSIVRQLVEMHNGKLWMNSSGVAGEGSIFSFTLPVYKNQ